MKFTKPARPGTRPGGRAGSGQPLDTVLDVLLRMERDGRAALQALAAASFLGALALAASGPIGVARSVLAVLLFLAAPAAVAAGSTPAACMLTLRLRALPAVARMQTVDVTPAALMMLCDKLPSGTYYTPTRRGRALRTVLQGLTRKDRSMLHAAARSRAEQLGIDDQALALVGRYPDYDGPISDLEPLLALRGSEQDRIDTCERAARRLHDRSGARGPGGRLLRQVTIPLAAVPDQRRRIVALLIQHAAASGTLDGGTVAELDRAAGDLDAVQLQVLEQLASCGSDAPETLLDAASML